MTPNQALVAVLLVMAGAACGPFVQLPSACNDTAEGATENAGDFPDGASPPTDMAPDATTPPSPDESIGTRGWG